MTAFNKGLYFLLICISLFSCRIEKRLYNDGYYVSWNKKETTEKKVAARNQEIFATKEIIINDKASLINKHKSLNDYCTNEVNSIVRSNAKVILPEKLLNRTLADNSNSIVTINNTHKITHVKKIVDENPKPKKEPLKITGVNFWDWILEFFIWVLAAIAGIVSAVFIVLFSLFFIDIIDESNVNRPNFRKEKKTFKLVFLKAFNIACSTMTAILWLSTFVLLCYVIYINFGIWWLLLLIVALLLIVPFILNLFGKMFGFGKIFRLP